MEWLQKEIESPGSLSRICICAIRQRLVMADKHGRSIHRSIDKLLLPTEMKRQLKLQNTSDIKFSSDLERQHRRITELTDSANSINRFILSHLKGLRDAIDSCHESVLIGRYECATIHERHVTTLSKASVIAKRRIEHQTDRNRNLLKQIYRAMKTQWKQVIKQPCNVRR
jgi:hypothetical protein